MIAALSGSASGTAILAQFSDKRVPPGIRGCLWLSLEPGPAASHEPATLMILCPKAPVTVFQGKMANDEGREQTIDHSLDARLSRQARHVALFV
jgi:hypothetical protein